MVRKRMPHEQRKKQKLAVAKDLFLEKGFSQTTMEDVFRKSDLSKGGLYHYYSNTEDMLYDLIVYEGSDQRFASTLDYKNQHREMPLEDIIVEVTLLKLFDDNDYRELYIMLLMEKKNSPRLEALYQKLMANSIRRFEDFIEMSGLDDLRFLTDLFTLELMNAIMIGVSVLDARELMLAHGDIFRKWISDFIAIKKHANFSN